MTEWIPFLLFVAAGVILLITSAVIVNYYEKEDERRISMNKFKVGDIVIGNEKANEYGITVQGTIGVVTDIIDSRLIMICVDKSLFTVLADRFDKCGTTDGRLVSTNPISLKIKRVIFNDPATIVLWADGTKTVVKVHDEPFDAEKGLAMAILKKLCGKAQLRKEFKKWIAQN